MRRQTSLLFLGLFAASAAAQAAACSSDDSTVTSGADSGTDAPLVQEDTGAPITPDCNGPLPVMTVRNPDGGAKLAPDWSCYATGASFFSFDDAGDAGDAPDTGSDASDASDAATDATPPPPADAGNDSGAADAGPPVADAGPSYLLHIVDFSSGASPIGATIDVFWGTSTEGTPAFSGLLGDGGLLAYPAPPAGTAYLSYRIEESTTQVPLYWHASPVIPPGVDTAYLGNGQIEANSISKGTEASLFSAAFGSSTPLNSLAVIVAGAVDCQGNDVEGAQFTLIDPNGNPVQSGSAIDDPHALYFVDNFPQSACTYTNNVAKGVWVMVNAPVNDPGSLRPYKLQMSGRMTADAPSTGSLIVEGPAEMYAGAVSILRPTHYNGPPPNVPDGG